MMEESKRKATLEKLTKKLSDMFVDEVRASDEKALKERVVRLSKEIEDIEDAKKSDATLNTLKEQLKDLSGGYRDAKKEKSNHLKFILLTMEDRGNL